jgi:hypothetical protein
MWRMTKRGRVFVKSRHADKSRDYAYHGTTSHCEARYCGAIEMVMDQRFDRSTLQAMLFAPACSTHRYSQRAVNRVANALRLNEEDRAILHILASRETFHSVRVILDG